MAADWEADMKVLSRVQDSKLWNRDGQNLGVHKQICKICVQGIGYNWYTTKFNLVLFVFVEIQMWIVETENSNNQFCPEFQAQGHALQFGTFVQISAELTAKPYSHSKKTAWEYKWLSWYCV